jgi:hypothetical protein
MQASCLSSIAGNFSHFACDLRHMFRAELSHRIAQPLDVQQMSKHSMPKVFLARSVGLCVDQWMRSTLREAENHTKPKKDASVRFLSTLCQ